MAGRHFDITNQLVAGKAPITLSLKKGDIVKYRCNCGEMILIKLIGYEDNIPQWELWDHYGYPLSLSPEKPNYIVTFQTTKCSEGIVVSVHLLHKPKFSISSKAVFDFWERNLTV